MSKYSILQRASNLSVIILLFTSAVKAAMTLSRLKSPARPHKTLLIILRLSLLRQSMPQNYEEQNNEGCKPILILRCWIIPQNCSTITTVDLAGVAAVRGLKPATGPVSRLRRRAQRCHGNGRTPLLPGYRYLCLVL